MGGKVVIRDPPDITQMSLLDRTSLVLNCLTARLSEPTGILVGAKY